MFWLGLCVFSNKVNRVRLPYRWCLARLHWPFTPLETPLTDPWWASPPTTFCPLRLANTSTRSSASVSRSRCSTPKRRWAEPVVIGRGVHQIGCKLQRVVVGFLEGLAESYPLHVVCSFKWPFDFLSCLFANFLCELWKFYTVPFFQWNGVLYHSNGFWPWFQKFLALSNCPL